MSHIEPHNRQSGALRADGKPMRALRVLATATQPLHEEQVWVRAKRDAFDTASWHKALASLVAHGFAERTGGRGGYCWAITDAGRRTVEL